MLTVKSFRGQITQGTGTSSLTTNSTWTSRTSAADNFWYSVTYGNGLFVAVSASGTGNRVMTSPDGVVWTSRTSAANSSWYGVTYGNGLFVAVSITGVSSNRVMTSPNGFTWTLRTTPVNNAWISVTYGNGLFVAVSYDGVNNSVMTSPDGITWTSRTTNNNSWQNVTYGNGLFVAVAASGTNDRVMTSPDGITWTTRTTNNNVWVGVAYGNGLFVAVSVTGTGNRVMTSPDGITWTSRTSAANNDWNSVKYGNGLWVAVASTGTGNRVMTSPDGITWTSQTSAANNFWTTVTYGKGLFVAVSTDGTNNRVMTSWISAVASPVLSIDPSTKFVTYNSTYPSTVLPPYTGGTGNILTYNPNTNVVTWNNATVSYPTNDLFTLTCQDYGSTIKANNVMVPATSFINGDFTLAAGAASAIYTTTVYNPKTSSITGVTFYQRLAGVYTGTTGQVGLYQYAGVTGTLLASSTNDTALYKQTAGTFFSKAFTNPLTIPPGDYIIAFLHNASATTTAPILGGINTIAGFTNIPSFNLLNGAKFSGFRTTQTTMPNPLMWSNLTQTAPAPVSPWAVLY